MFKDFLKANKVPVFFTLTFLVKNTILLLDVNVSYLSPFYFLVTFAMGMVFFLPAYFLSKRSKLIYTLIVAMGTTLILFGDLVYFRYYSTVPSFSSIILAPQLLSVSDSIFSLIKFRDIILFADLLLAFYFFKKLAKESEFKLRPIQTVFLVTLPLLIFAGVGIYDRKESVPRFIKNAYESKLIVQRYGVFGSHFFDGYRTFFKAKIALSEEAEKETFAWLLKNASQESDNSKTGQYAGKNVIIVNVESLQNFVIGKSVEGQEITPNLNRLLKESYYFNNHQFTVGLGNTSDADITANTSIYPLTDVATAVQFHDNDFTSLPKALKKEGYSTAAYHGFFRDFWNRSKFFKSLGFDTFSAKDNYSDAQKIGMGLNDITFFKETVAKIKKQPAPSYNYLITLSSHHPFSINDEDKVINITRENYNEEAYRYYNLIAYTDNAIGIFIDELKKAGLYDESVIVFYGDHIAKVGDLTSPKTIDSIGYRMDKKDDYLNFNKTPLIIRLPEQKKGFVRNDISAITDIMPTVLNLVGVKTDYPMLGRDLFGKKEPFFTTSLLQLQAFTTNGSVYFWDDGGAGFCTDFFGNQRELEECRLLKEKKNSIITTSQRMIKSNLFNRFLEYKKSRQKDNSGLE
jgi:lipoteichoic acid synthase